MSLIKEITLENIKWFTQLKYSSFFKNFSNDPPYLIFSKKRKVLLRCVVLWCYRWKAAYRPSSFYRFSIHNSIKEDSVGINIAGKWLALRDYPILRRYLVYFGMELSLISFSMEVCAWELYFIPSWQLDITCIWEKDGRNIGDTGDLNHVRS